MPHSYRKDADQADVIAYKKTHADGRETVIQATDLGNGWQAFARDYPGGKVGIGTFPSKAEARRALTDWARRHPQGVSGGGLDFGAGLDLGGGGGPFGGGGMF